MSLVGGIGSASWWRRSIAWARDRTARWPDRAPVLKPMLDEALRQCGLASEREARDPEAAKPEGL